MFDNRELVRRLLRELFFEGPSLELPTFLPSALFEARRDANHAVGPSGGHLLLNTHKLSLAWNVEALIPPAEAALIGNLFGAEPVVLVASGAGSGKSSALIHLRAYAHYLADKLGRLGHTLPTGSLLFVADLQDLSNDLKLDRPMDQQPVQIEGFLRAVCEQLGYLLDGIPEHQLNAAYKGAFEHDAHDDLANETKVVRNIIMRTTQDKFRGGGTPLGFVRKALEAADVALVTPHRAVVSRLLLIREIADTQLRDTGYGLVLVIDNVDPFPEYVQTALVKTIQIGAYGLRSVKLANPRGLTIAIFARLSTSERHTGALDGVLGHTVNFLAPDPADVILFRIAAFLLQPAVTPQFRALTGQDQHAVVMRACALFERLLDSTDQFYRVFSGMAGTNIRTACKLARKWLLSTRLPMAELRATRPEPRQTIKLVSFGLVLRCALALERALLAGELTRERRELAAMIAGWVCPSLHDLFVTSRLVHDPDRPELGDGNLRTRSATRDRSQEASVPLMLADEELRLAFGPVARAVDILAQLGGVSIGDRAGFRDDVELALKIESTHWAVGALPESEARVVAKMTEVLFEEIARGASGVAPSRTADFLDGFRVTVFQGKVLPPNRWESVHILFEQGVAPVTAAAQSSAEEADSTSAINVFSADGVNLCPIALHVLCILCDAGQQSVDATGLRTQLLGWGYSEEDILRVLTQMIEIDRRLIFSGVRDVARGVRSWMDGFHQVHLSSAGREYLDSVVPSAAYLQWALYAPAGIRKQLQLGVGEQDALGSGLRRLEVALRGLELVADEESGRLWKILERGSQPFRRSLTPFSWVYFRGLEALIEDASGLIRTNPEQAKAVATGFLRLAESVLASRSEMLGMNHRDWEESYSRAVRTHEIRFGPG